MILKTPMALSPIESPQYKSTNPAANSLQDVNNRIKILLLDEHTNSSPLSEQDSLILEEYWFALTKANDQQQWL